jgi:tetratricopeptide (TPR) repeat protein
MKISYRKTLLLINRIGLGVVLVIVSGGFTEAQTLPPDVGIITQLSGGVTYRNEEYQKTPEKAQAFMKILQGDYFQLEEKAMVQLVYFRSGRKETWKGPAAFIAGEVQSQVKSEKGIQAQPELKILPSGVLEGVRRVPVLLQRAGLGRSGIMQVRGLGESLHKSKVPNEEKRAEIETAKEEYRDLRNQTKDDDLTPELYLLGILANYDQFEEMEKVIKEALKRQPDVEDLKKLEEWVKTHKTEPTKK